MPYARRIAIISNKKTLPSSANRRFAFTTPLPDDLIMLDFQDPLAFKADWDEASAAALQFWVVMNDGEKSQVALGPDASNMLRRLLVQSIGLDRLEFSRYHIDAAFGPAYKPQEVWPDFIRALRSMFDWLDETVELTIDGDRSESDAYAVTDILNDDTFPIRDPMTGVYEFDLPKEKEEE